MKNLLYLVAAVFLIMRCSKSDQFTHWPYRVEPTKEIFTNYIQINDLFGGNNIDSNYTKLTFIDFYSLPSSRNMLDSLMQAKKLPINGYYEKWNGTWKIRYVGPFSLINADSLQWRQNGNLYLGEQILILKIDSRLWGKPLFEIWHEPTNTVYARYVASAAGAQLELKFSGPSNARFDTLSANVILDQFRFKLTPNILGRHLYVH